MNFSKSILMAFLLFIVSTSVYSMAGWDGRNRPDLMVMNYESVFSNLPTSGQLTFIPWSDDYWPTSRGGITYRWNQENGDYVQKYGYPIIPVDKITKGMSVKELSPAEKYDLYLARYDFPLTKFERSRTRIMKTVEGSSEYDSNFTIPGWEGLCHAWAPATLLFKNPKPIKVINPQGIEIEFGSSDIKALLIYFLHSSKNERRTNFLGSRCNLNFDELREKVSKGEITEEQLKRKMNSPECTDTNAGAFHVALVNQIALKNEGFVADITRDAEVWNQPVYGFKTKIISEKEGASEGAAAGTVKEISVETEMMYIGEVSPTWEYATEHYGLRTKVYQYRLELNSKGKIIGGEWSNEERPDFIWKQTKPSFSGFFAPLKALYEKSI
ncbi:MAG: hypothetical protein HQK49_18385 [Oligoflexia bacterium]|nr:hypothetical protein [Oligoflexia bacterium]